uniref:Uncharacterized protein n=1 Tax=Chenopodium quinoa TaxID=63459 RepID=A0A803LQV9_CHEQI
MSKVAAEKGLFMMRKSRLRWKCHFALWWSYEEYLEAHTRSIKQAGRISHGKEDSSSKERDLDDLQSHSEHGSSRKRSRR